MSTHYDILGIPSEAGINDIKRAFRRLAKLYHPDKNPTDREVFNKILRAYEVLSNPVSRSAYDHKLEYKIYHEKPAQKNTTKNWRFDEREIKRRKYYDEHIKQYAKAEPVYKNTSPEKKSYNEYKYILFATPLAVALVLLIIYLASPERPKHKDQFQTEPTKTENSSNKSELFEDGPYTLFFGGSKFDTRRTNKFTVLNTTTSDLIFCLFGESGFIRSMYLKNAQQSELNYLPEETFVIRYCSGHGFDASALNKESGALGDFMQDKVFYKSFPSYSPSGKNEVILTEGLNPNFTSISEKEFFNNQF